MRINRKIIGSAFYFSKLFLEYTVSLSLISCLFGNVFVRSRLVKASRPFFFCSYIPTKWIYLKKRKLFASIRYPNTKNTLKKKPQ